MVGTVISNNAYGNSILQHISFAQGKMRLKLRDGKEVSILLRNYPKLARATAAQLNHWQISAAGQGIYWPKIDEDLSISGLIRDAN